MYLGLHLLALTLGFRRLGGLLLGSPEILLVVFTIINAILFELGRLGIIFIVLLVTRLNALWSRCLGRYALSRVAYWRQ